MAIPQESGSTLLNPTMLDLLSKAIGGTTDQNTSTGTNTSQTNNTTGGTTTKNLADVSALQQVFQQQQAGITPEMLAAIFSEGSKAAPGLVSATANAVGARSSQNTPLATALGNLSAQLTSKAAELSLGQRNASANTAAQIAQATGGTQTDQNQTQTQTGNNTTQTNNQVDTQPNYGNVTKLIGLLLGGNTLDKGLGNVGGIGGAVGKGSDALAGLLKQLIGGSAGTGDGTKQIPAFSGGGLDPAAGGEPAFGGAGVGTPTGIGIGSAEAGQTLEQMLGQIGASGGGEDEFWKAIGIDPDSLTFGTQPGGTTPGVDADDWWTSEGWDTIDWGG